MMMITWRDINSAPRDGTSIVCWAPGWDEPCFLRYKTNHRIVDAHKSGSSLELNESYFGDISEWDDYDLAIPENAPTLWHPLDDVTTFYRQEFLKIKGEYKMTVKELIEMLKNYPEGAEVVIRVEDKNAKVSGAEDHVYCKHNCDYIGKVLVR